MGVSLDEAAKAVEAEMAKPLPGSTRVTESVAEDEMAVFMQAAAAAR